jgi:hypothetical protein
MPRSEPEVLSEIRDVEIIAVNASIRDRARLKKFYGGGRWRKLKGIAFIRTVDGEEFTAEIHWYECHGIGRREIKVVREIE